VAFAAGRQARRPGGAGYLFAHPLSNQIIEPVHGLAALL
jgi:hypothetical protein